MTAARLAFRYLTTPDEPTNEGSFKPLHVVLPEGKFLSAGPKAALAPHRRSRRVETSRCKAGRAPAPAWGLTVAVPLSLARAPRS